MSGLTGTAPRQTPAATGSIPGVAGQIVAALGERAHLCDLYDDLGAGVYEELSADDPSEVREILMAARAHPGPLLELAAGAGRIALPLLASGRDVTALDLSMAMLRRLTARLGELPDVMRRRCRLVHASMAEFNLDERFGVVVLASTSVSMLDAAQRASMLTRVRQHLIPGGVFLLTVPDFDCSAETAEDRHRLVGRSGAVLEVFEYHRPGDAHRHITVMPGDRAQGRVLICTSAPRALDRAELLSELDDARFEIAAAAALPPVSRRLQEHLLTLEVRR